MNHSHLLIILHLGIFLINLHFLAPGNFLLGLFHLWFMVFSKIVLSWHYSMGFDLFWCFKAFQEYWFAFSHQSRPINLLGKGSFFWSSYPFCPQSWWSSKNDNPSRNLHTLSTELAYFARNFNCFCLKRIRYCFFLCSYIQTLSNLRTSLL